MRPPAASHRRKLLLLVGALFVGGLAAGVIVQRIAGSSGSPATTATKLDDIHSTAPPQRASVAKHLSPRAPVSAEATTELAANAMSSFDALQRGLPGPVEVAVMPVSSSRATIFGSDLPAHGWSTTKIPVIAALMTALGARDLSYEQQSEVKSAITESSNEAILSLFHALEGIEGGLAAASEAVEAELRDSGDRYTVVATEPPPPGAVTTFGQTEWAPEAATLFLSALDAGCLLPAPRTRHILSLMQQIEPSESWGLGSAGFAHVAFKGGWGPEGDTYLVRQSGVIDPESSDAVAVAIIAHPPAGESSFAAGTEMLTRTATWLRRVVRPVAHRIICP